MIPKIEVTRLGGYTRDVGYKTGSITYEFETKIFNHNRSIRLLTTATNVEEVGARCGIKNGLSHLPSNMSFVQSASFRACSYSRRLHQTLEYCCQPLHSWRAPMSQTRFSWIPAYSAIAQGIYNLRDDRPRLLELFHSIFDNNQGLSFPINAEEEELVTLDPFTSFASFNRGISWNNRNRIIRLALDGLGCQDVATPADYTGLPFVHNMKSWFFAGRQDRGEHDIDNLWDLFCAAMELASNPASSMSRGIMSNMFDTVRSQLGIKWNITIGLYWIQPECFMPLDAHSRDFLAGAYGIKVKDSTLPTGEEYLAVMDALRAATDKPFYEISADAYLWKPAPKTPKGWHPKLEEYNPGIDSDTWDMLLDDPAIFNMQARALLRRMMDAGGKATCSHLAEKYGENMNYYLGAANGMAQRVAKALKCPLWEEKYWPILFYGKNASKEEKGVFLWMIRPELQDALKSRDLSDVPLYVDHNADKDASASDGSKQYWWLNANRSIWSFSEIAVGEEQSYTIRNEKGNPRRIFKNFLNARAGDVVVGYETTPVKKIVAICEVSKPQDGERLYFKKLRDLDTPVPFSDIKSDPVLSQCEFCKNPNGSFFKLTEEEYLRLEEMLDEDDASPVQTSAKKSYTDAQFLQDVFVSKFDLAAMKGLLERKKNLILQGAPGTGKTYAARRLAYAMMGEEDDSRIGFVQFHQSYTYEDFVIGYRPNSEGGFDIQPGIFADFCSRAARDSRRSYFFIIDEINRANISKVFGELLMLIEADHRGDSIELSLDRRRLTVPKNLYIIGMMNTADRGLALIDYALRRRFAFFDMKPALDAPGFQVMLQKANNKKLVALVDKVREVNTEIEKDQALGQGFCIGHSYFCVREGITDGDVHGIARFEIEPLIAEYWFDDQQKVRSLTDKLESVFTA
ncbi:AAA family ATPase [Enorma sp.]|uniref:AAA family ATPase n=1 Tax=Enorma sp. TaxID=1920692 RepID=UPI0025BA4413|nr:AAA family ATPase [Enorma sp.]